MISESTVYRSYRVETIHTEKLELTKLPTPSDTDWKLVRGFVFTPRIAPIDTKVLCKAEGNGAKP